MSRPELVFEQEIEGALHHTIHNARAPQMQLVGGESQQQQQHKKPSNPLDHQQEFHQKVHHNVHQNPNHDLYPKRRERRKEAQLVANEEDQSSNFGDEVELKAAHELLPVNIPKQRKKSTTFQQKADLFHSAQPSEIKPNLLVPEDAASPRIQKAQNFTLKPHQEGPLDYQPYTQQSRTHQLQQETHHHGKRRKQSMQARQVQHVVKNANMKKLPAISNTSQGRYQQSSKNPITIKQSSIIILHSTDNKPNEHQIVDSFHHLEQELIDSSLQHILKPLQSNSTFTFTRDNFFYGNCIHPYYELTNIQNVSFITSRKQFCHYNSYYTFAHDRQEIGFLTGNFGGTQFNLYQSHDGRPRLVATIIYKSECFCGESFRDISVFITTVRHSDPVFQRKTSKKNLKELYEEGHSQQILKLRTKQPVWNQKKQCFVLKMGGKGTLPSVKNMILIPENAPDRQLLLFCKRGAHTFHLQLCAPLNIFMGMGILMSSFDFKLLCQ